MVSLANSLPEFFKQVSAGRTSTIDLGTEGSFRILRQPDLGHVSVNPDGTLSLVISDPKATGTTSFDVAVTGSDGTQRAITSEIEIIPPAQLDGWGKNDHYVLQTDDQGRTVVEHGDSHRKVFVTDGDHGVTKSQIAVMLGQAEGEVNLQNVFRDVASGKIGGNVALLGTTEALAVSVEVGQSLWQSLNWYDAQAGGNSNWLLLERGHEYDIGQIVVRGSQGESELHPKLVTAWGEGEKPVVTNKQMIWQEESSNYVFQDVDFTGSIFGLIGENFIFENATISERGAAFQGMDKVTIRNSGIEDTTREAPADGVWNPHATRSAGLYVAGMDGLLIESTIIHHNAWADDYQEAGGGQPPSMYSHNVYLQDSTRDVTFRDNIVSQGASFGAQFRGGAYVENNAWIDNNIAFSLVGGDYRGAGPVGNFSYVADNVVTSAGYKVAPQIGAVSGGIDDPARQTTFKGNIVAHLANPDDPAEMAQKIYSNGALTKAEDAYFDDTVIWNWLGSKGGPHPSGKESRNVEGLDHAALDAATIQNLASEILGYNGATIADFMDHIQANGSVATGAPVTADTIVQWFQDRFGVDRNVQASEIARFVPDERAEGVRWDNRINWQGDAMPAEGQAVDLGGNHVTVGAMTLRIGALDLGHDGAVSVTSGRLETGKIEVDDSGRIHIEDAGQFWTMGYDGADRLVIAAEGGRFANEGDVTGLIEMHLSGNAQAILASGGRFLFQEGSSLEVVGSAVKVGMDGNARVPASVTFLDGSTLSFVADAKGISTLGEFRSGAFGEGGVESMIDIGGAQISVDLSAWNGIGTLTLVDADALVGTLDEGSIEITGLGARDAEFRVDHDADTVVLTTTAGNGIVSFSSTIDPTPVPAPVEPVPSPPVDPIPAPIPVDGERLDGFKAEWFSAPKDVDRLSAVDFDAEPIHENVLDSLAFDASRSSQPFWEGGARDYFAGRITGDIKIEKAGLYTFHLNSDDGSMLSLDGKQVIVSDRLQAATEKSVTLHLEKGSIPIEVLYFERAGHQVLELGWSGPDTAGMRRMLDATSVSSPNPNYVAPSPTQIDGFKAEWFSAPKDVDRLSAVDFDAEPIHENVLDSLAFDASRSSQPFWEGGARDYFAGRITGDIKIEKAGLYTFHLNSDDGSMLSLDGKQVIVSDRLQAATEKSVTLHLEKGSIPIEVLYFERAGHQVLELGWSGPDTAGMRQLVGGGAVSHFAPIPVDLSAPRVIDVIPDLAEDARAVHVSGASNALDAFDLAKLAGMTGATFSMQVLAEWLVQRPEYGSMEKPLDAEMGSYLFAALIRDADGSSSDHFLLERGYDYDIRTILPEGASGASLDQPIVLAAWGVGHDPKVSSMFEVAHADAKNILVRDIDFDGGARIEDVDGIRLDNVTFFGGGVVLQDVDHFDLVGTQIVEVRNGPALDVSGSTDGSLTDLLIDMVTAQDLEEVGVMFRGGNERLILDRIAVDAEIDFVIAGETNGVTVGEISRFDEDFGEVVDENDILAAVRDYFDQPDHVST